MSVFATVLVEVLSHTVGVKLSVIIFGLRGQCKIATRAAGPRRYDTARAPLTLQSPECSAGILAHQSERDDQLEYISIIVTSLV